MDAEYLKENVGAALAIGLAETAIAQPDDPIEYFALWLTKYVQNQKRGQQQKENALKLEEERRKHSENLEFDRLKTLADQRRKEEEENRIQEEKVQRRSKRFRALEDGRTVLEAELNAIATSSKEEDIRKRRSDLLYASKARYKLAVSFVSESPKNEFVDLQNKITDTNELTIIKAVLTTLGFGLKFSKWIKVKQILKRNDIQRRMVEYLPTAAQPIKKFQVIATLLHRLNKTALIQSDPPFLFLILLEWLEKCIALRNAALGVKFNRLGEQYRPDPMIDPDLLDEDEEDDREQDDLKVPIEQNDPSQQTTEDTGEELEQEAESTEEEEGTEEEN